MLVFITEDFNLLENKLYDKVVTSEKHIGNSFYRTDISPIGMTACISNNLQLFLQGGGTWEKKII